jgi:hypothetical protein
MCIHRSTVVAELPFRGCGAVKKKKQRDITVLLAPSVVWLHVYITWLLEQAELATAQLLK